MIVVRFLALVTTMVTKVDGNHRSNDCGNHCSNDCGNHRSNHRGYYNGYYDDNTRFLHLSHRILPYLMTIACEIIENLKNSSKKYIIGEKMYFHCSNYRSNHDGYYDGYHDRYYNGYHDQPWLPL